jgi:hypothetical protein
LAVSRTGKLFLAILLLVVTALGYWAKGWMDIDRCLDGGGRWNYDKGVCEH